ncbi:MAG TPA: GNAT family N-acetyltransferase [Micromonosporaceae bacterium]|nr:GNAT family N-acetyltransferase [Micromonosporaceae bacterium]
MFPSTKIATDGLVLRPFDASDVDRIVIGCNDKEVQRWLPLPCPYSREVATAWCTTDAERLRTEGEGLHLAISTPDGYLLGNVSLKKTHWRYGITEIGYWVMPDARGKGIATTACRALSTWALGDERIFRVELTAAPGNVSSQRVAEKVGFSFEGIARSGGIVHHGRTDLLIYSLIRNDLMLPNGCGALG